MQFFLYFLFVNFYVNLSVQRGQKEYSFEIINPISYSLHFYFSYENYERRPILNKEIELYGFSYSYFADLLLSLRYYLNTVIFKSNVIKSFEFNIGSRTFQLDYESQHELPAALINYQGSRAVSTHTYTYQRTGMNNINSIPVLYNRTKDLQLNLQEELYEITIDITINCSTQLQALEIERVLQAFSPLDRYFQNYRFYSFMKVNKEFLHPNIFNPNTDLIYNLFTKYNRKTDTVDFCFAVEYNPLVKFETCQAQLSSSEARSFSVSCSVSVMTPIPIFQFIPSSQTPLIGKPIRTYNRTDIVAATGEVDMLLISFRNEEITAPVIMTDVTTGAFTATFVREEETHTITGIIKTEEIVCDGNITVNDQQFMCTFDIVKDLLEDTFTITVSGPLVGTLTHAEYDETQIIGYLSTTLNNQVIESYITVDDLNIIRSSKKLSSFAVQKNITQNIKILTVKNIYNTNLDLSPRRMKLQTNSSFITKLILVDSLNNKVTVDLTSSKIPIGSTSKFNGVFSFVDGLEHTGVLMGSIDKNGRLDYDVTISDESYVLAIIYFDLEFETGDYYGLRTIERQSLEITFTNELISTDSGLAVSQDLFDNKTMGITKQGPGHLLRSTGVIDDEIITDPSDDTKVLITITLDDLFNYNTYSSNNFWRFIFHKQIFTSGDQDAISFKQASKTYELQFQADKIWFYKHFNSVSSDNPIFFQFFVVE